jgi:ferredoxin
LAIDEEIINGKKGKPHHSCAKCGECIQVCPRSAIRIVFKPAEWVKKKFGVSDISKNGGIESGDASVEVVPTSENRTGFLNKAVIAVLQFGRELIEPRMVFTVTAFVLGAALSFSFATGTFTRIINLLLSGSFTLGY